MRRILKPLVLAALMPLSAMALSACSHEVSHTETTGNTWTGGTQHEETTVYKNPDGTISTEHEKQITNP